MSKCIKCGRTLTYDEIGLHKKMVDRGAQEFMCITCIAEYFRCDEDLLRNKIEHFRRMGCLLFSPEPPKTSE